MYVYSQTNIKYVQPCNTIPISDKSVIIIERPGYCVFVSSWVCSIFFSLRITVTMVSFPTRVRHRNSEIVILK